MNKSFNSKALPDVPSQIIRLAIADLEKVEKDERYRVDMSYWHVPRADNSKCVVCLAGAVMAGTLGADPETFLDPDSFTLVSEHDETDEDVSLTHKLLALDALRSGEFGQLLESCGLGDRVDEVEDAYYADVDFYSPPSYSVDPDGFKAWMLQAATILEGFGL